MNPKFTLIISIFLSFFCASQTSYKESEKLNDWLSINSEKGFIENKGQMMDMSGKPVPFVFFKTEAPGLNFWITEEGITLQTLYSPEKDEYRLDNEPQIEHERTRTFEELQEASRNMKWERIDIKLNGAKILKENVNASNPIVGHFNYFYPHCSDGIYGVKEYGEITIEEVYDGIDWVIYRRKDGSLKHEFVVHPGADHTQIELLYKSKTPIKLNAKGQLEMYTDYGNLIEGSPISFIDGKEINSGFNLGQSQPILVQNDAGYETSVHFDIERTPTGNETLIIDPELIWATFFGGNGHDGVTSIDTDPEGNLVLVGYSASTNFPVQDNGLTGSYFQQSFEGGPDQGDAAILKFSPSGERIWVTYYGGGYIDYAQSVSVNSNGNIFVTGNTVSNTFPLFDPGNGAYFQPVWGEGWFGDPFILKFNSNGERLWATYYGGSSNEFANSITILENNNIVIVGNIAGTDVDQANFSVHNPGNGAYFQPTPSGTINNCFIAEFSEAGVQLWATVFGGISNQDQANVVIPQENNNIIVAGTTGSTDFPSVDPGGGAYFSPTFNFGTYNQREGFIMRFDSDRSLVWSTYFSGNSLDNIFNGAYDDQGNIVLVGETASTNLPIVTPSPNSYSMSTALTGFNAAREVFMVRFDSNNSLNWCSYLGAQNTYAVNDGVAIDKCGNTYISVGTYATNLTTMEYCNTGYTSNFSQSNSEYYTDHYLLRLSSDLELEWATYFGGDGDDIRGALAADSSGNVYFSGEWTEVNNSQSYPIADNGNYYDEDFNGGEDDVFIARFQTLPVEMDFTYVNDTNCNCSGNATVNILNNFCNSPVSISWEDESGAVLSNQDAMITDLCAGNYSMVLSGDCFEYKSDFTISDNCGSDDNGQNEEPCFQTPLPQLPNVFTPNNDGINDLFVLEIPESKVASYSIINRWGNIVAEGKDVTEIHWDGTDTKTGRDCNEASYFIRIEVSCPLYTETKSGFIQLTR